MSDPLSLVRQATITGTPVNYSDGHYIFGEFKFHENSKTAFKRSLKSANDYFYTLRDVIFFLENADVTVADYRRKAVETRTTAVVEQDRQALKNYLTGVVDTCPQIDLAAAAEFAKPVASSEGTKEPQISSEKLQEQRQKQSANIDKTGQKKASTASAEDSSAAADKFEELRALRKKRKAEGAGEDEEIEKAFIEADRVVLAKLRSDETPAQTRSTVLCAANMDFQLALKLFNDRVLKPKDLKTAAASIAAPAASSAVAPSSTPSAMSERVAAANRALNLSREEGGSIVEKPRVNPIIIVPSAVTSVITGLNAKELLIDGIYTPVEVKRQQQMATSGGGLRKDKEQVILRPSSATGRSQAYKIIDDPTKLSDADWGRVVAVFVTGQQWQFKGWKYSNPVDLFQHVLGVHVAIDDRVLDPTVLTWNCKVLKVNRYKQHLNAGAGREFWMYLDDFVRLKKPHLSPPPPHQGGGGMVMPLGVTSSSSAGSVTA